MTTLAPPPANAFGEQSKAQAAFPMGLSGGACSFGASLIWANGGNFENPMGFPRYAQLYRPGYWTYKWMLQHPTVRLVRCIATAAIIASSWTYRKARKSTPDEHVTFIQETFDPLRRRFVEDALRSRDHGWAPFEPIWDNADGAGQTLTRIKPLANPITQVIADKAGNFTGLAQPDLYGIETHATDSLGNKVPALAAPFKALLCTYDSEFGGLHGRSWLENIRETGWKMWLDQLQQLQKLCAKVAGTQMIGKSPAAKRAQVIKLISDLAKGASGGWVESLAMAVDNPDGLVDKTKLMMELAKASFVNIDLLDHGNNASSIAGILANMLHAEDLIFQGGLRSSRTGLEGKHGTKSEAGVHTDTGTTAAELDDDLIASQAQPLVDCQLYLKYGPDAVGGVTIEPAPLVNTKAETYLQVLLEGLADPTAGPVLCEGIKWQDVLDGVDVPSVDGFDFAAALQKFKAEKQAADAAKTAALAKQPAGAPAKVNGNKTNGNKVNGKPRGAELMRLSRWLGKTR